MFSLCPQGGKEFRTRPDRIPRGRAFILLALFLALSCLTIPARRAMHAARGIQGPRVHYVPSLTALRLMSLGAHPAMADLVWLKAVLYMGEHLEAGAEMKWLSRYLDAIIALDPKFRYVYQWGGVVMQFNRNAPTQEDIRRSVRYYELGYKQFPDHYPFAFALTVNYLFRLKSKDPDEQARFTELGLGYAEHASRMPEAPDYLSGLVAERMVSMGKGQLAVAYLREMAWMGDENIKRMALRELSFLEDKAEAERLREERERIESAWRRDFPYVPLDLYLFLRPPQDHSSASTSSTALEVDVMRNLE